MLRMNERIENDESRLVLLLNLLYLDPLRKAHRE